MSFLQPAILLGLPIILLPIVIHLINQRRFQTVDWGAMRFLLAANRMSRGYARLRQWLILAARTLAVAGLIFAVSRPLSSGILGLAGGGQVDTTIILLDRSPSMLQQNSVGAAKLDSALQQLSDSLQLLRSNRYVLIDSATVTPVEFEQPEQLLELPETLPVSQSADLPEMLDALNEYIRKNRPSRCEVWICSDVRTNDWKDDSSRWDVLRGALGELPQMVNIHLLAYSDIAESNRSIRVTRARKIVNDDGPQLLLSLAITQTPPLSVGEVIPVGLELDGARSELSVEMTSELVELQDYAVPIDGESSRGWGRVSIPADTSPADNEFFFVYHEPIDRKTLIVTDQPETTRPLEFAAMVSAEQEVSCTAETVSVDQAVTASLDEVSLLVWHAPLPEEDDPLQRVLQSASDRGVNIIFVPPDFPTASGFAGLRWGDWRDHTDAKIGRWVSDQDLLANTSSGASLPLDELTVSRSCRLEGDHRTLASLEDGTPILSRALTDGRNVYFCSTTTAQVDSSLATNGVVAYAIIQRAVAAGAKSLGTTRDWIAGSVPLHNGGDWTRVAGEASSTSSTYQQHAGVYESGEQLFAINRGFDEDASTVVARDRVDELFEGLNFDRVDDTEGGGAVLVQEIWRLFLILMLLALIAEAILSMPRAEPAEIESQLMGSRT